jgi:hypothetical protein
MPVYRTGTETIDGTTYRVVYDVPIFSARIVNGEEITREYLQAALVKSLRMQDSGYLAPLTIRHSVTARNPDQRPSVHVGQWRATRVDAVEIEGEPSDSMLADLLFVDEWAFNAAAAGLFPSRSAEYDLEAPHIFKLSLLSDEPPAIPFPLMRLDTPKMGAQPDAQAFPGLAPGHTSIRAASINGKIAQQTFTDTKAAAQDDPKPKPKEDDPMDEIIQAIASASAEDLAKMEAAFKARRAQMEDDEDHEEEEEEKPPAEPASASKQSPAAEPKPAAATLTPELIAQHVRATIAEDEARRLKAEQHRTAALAKARATLSAERYPQDDKMLARCYDEGGGDKGLALYLDAVRAHAGRLPGRAPTPDEPVEVSDLRATYEGRSAAFRKRVPFSRFATINQVTIPNGK